MRLKPFLALIIILFGMLVCTSVDAHNPTQSWRFLAGGSVSDFFSVSEFEFVFRLFISLILGLICGYSHGAGSGDGTSSVSISIKTFAAVCLGAATFTSVMIHVNYLTHIPNILNGIGNVITGIGFVCAAVIFKKDNIVSGLSTAATLWTSAGVGMACGSAMYGIAMTVTFILVLFHLLPSGKGLHIKHTED